MNDLNLGLGLENEAGEIPANGLAAEVGAGVAPAPLDWNKIDAAFCAALLALKKSIDGHRAAGNNSAIGAEVVIPSAITGSRLVVSIGKDSSGGLEKLKFADFELSAGTIVIVKHFANEFGKRSEALNKVEQAMASYLAKWRFYDGKTKPNMWLGQRRLPSEIHAVQEQRVALSVQIQFEL